MCDYSLQSVKSRTAKVGDKLISTNFGTGTGGFAGADDMKTAICLLPGTEIALGDEAIETVSKQRFPFLLRFLGRKVSGTAIFRQINLDNKLTHHDALEMPDGKIVLVHDLALGQKALVLQLPAKPRTAAEKKAQTRLETVG